MGILPLVDIAGRYRAVTHSADAQSKHALRQLSCKATTAHQYNGLDAAGPDNLSIGVPQAQEGIRADKETLCAASPPR